MYVKAVGTGLTYFQVQNKSHLLALSRVSRNFRFLVFPRLFEVLAIKANDEMSLWDLEWYPYFAYDIIARVPNVLTAVKELHFSAPFESTDLAKLEDRKRCLHSSIQDSSLSFVSSLGSEQDDSPISWEVDDAVTRKQEDAKFMEDLFDSEHGDNGLMKLATKMTRLLLALPDNQLTGFR